jgi:hypothetical protein
VIDRYLEPADNHSLTAVCDCYASLHRAEGFGLVLAEAMSLGKPVVATGYSGNLDFMTPSNSLLVDHRLVPIGPGAEPYPPGGEWAEPDTAHAARLMRDLFDDPEAARRLGAEGAAAIGRSHSLAAAGEVMYRRLESIRATKWPRPLVDAAASVRPALAALPLRMQQQPPHPGHPGLATPLRAFARRSMLRLIRPATAYQQTVNDQVLAALEELSGEITELRREAAGGRAEMLELQRRIDELEQR